MKRTALRNRHTASAALALVCAAAFSVAVAPGAAARVLQPAPGPGVGVPADAARVSPFEPLYASPPTAYAAQHARLTLAQATALAERRYKGRVVRAEAVKQGGRTIYEIRLLVDGRVRTVRIDAETGAFL